MTVFFLLDLTRLEAGKNLLGDAEEGFDLSQIIFGLVSKELEKFPFDLRESQFGYLFQL